MKLIDMTGNAPVSVSERKRFLDEMDSLFSIIGVDPADFIMMNSEKIDLRSLYKLAGAEIESKDKRKDIIRIISILENKLSSMRSYLSKENYSRKQGDEIIEKALKYKRAKVELLDIIYSQGLEEDDMYYIRERDRKRYVEEAKRWLNYTRRL